MTDRAALEWLVYQCLTIDEPIIFVSRGRELLRFETMEEMRAWYKKILTKSTQKNRTN